jgi:ankyrin repeat protein
MEKPHLEQQRDVNPNDLMRKMDQVIQYGSIADLEELFNNGMDINQTDFAGRTALQMMAFKGNEAAVRMLLSRGADVNYVYMHHDRVPMTALDAARESGKNEIANILLAHGAKLGKELN